MASKVEKRKALLFQRLVAYIIDVLLITMLVSIVSIPFTNTKSLEKLEKKQQEIMIKYQEGKINSDTYFIEYSDVYYKMSRDTGFTTLITILLEVLYFVVFQLYNGGQTIGKKIMKIRIISDDGDLSMNQMIFRSFIANFILVNLVCFVILLFSSKNTYFVSSVLITCIQYLLVFISFIMVGRKKDGRAIHDKLVHTTVIRED